ncbi:MAG: hypothetical protein MUC83_01680 [Pirellula sp.]|jgi:hypothetical protein|nr:hypothetical protein [Pirellula sp.]
MLRWIHLLSCLFVIVLSANLQAQPGTGGDTTGGGEEEADEWGAYASGPGGTTTPIPRTILNKRACLDVSKEKVEDKCPDKQSTTCPTSNCWAGEYHCVAFTVPPGPGDRGPQVKHEFDVLDTTSSFENYPEVGYNVNGYPAVAQGEPVICYRTTECICTQVSGFRGTCKAGTKKREYIIRQYSPNTSAPRCVKLPPPPRP